jgi:heat shock protein HtpX
MTQARTATLLSGAIAMAVVVAAAGATWAVILMLGLVGTTTIGLVIERRIACKREARHLWSGWPKRTVQPVVDDLAKRAGIQSPETVLIGSEAANAFTSGRGRPGTITVTSELLAALTERELKGVLAHEIAHIVRHDAQRLTWTALLCGLIAGTTSAGTVMAIAADFGTAVTFLTMIVAAGAAALFQMAFCRSREFSADHLGATLCGDPLSIAAALERIESRDLFRTTHAPRTWALETFRFGSRRDQVLGLLSTHPPSGERIFRLRRLAGLSDPWV